MAFFVIADRHGITAVYEYPNRDTVDLKPDETLIGSADTLEEAEHIETEYIFENRP